MFIYFQVVKNQDIFSVLCGNLLRVVVAKKTTIKMEYANVSESKNNNSNNNNNNNNNTNKEH